jgi:hypothetical protein
MTRRHLWLATTAMGLGLFTRIGTAQSLRAIEPLDASGRITYFIAEGAPGSQYRASDRDLATWALKAWERTLGGAVRFEPAAEPRALLTVHWVAAEDGLYGEMRPLLVNGRRGAGIYVRPDTSGLGSEIDDRARRDPLFRDTVVYLTCVHELGHALGLEHTDDVRDIMYFFGYGGDIPAFFGRYRARLMRRDDIAGASGLSAADIDRVRAVYGRR